MLAVGRETDKGTSVYIKYVLSLKIHPCVCIDSRHGFSGSHGNNKRLLGARQARIVV